MLSLRIVFKNKEYFARVAARVETAAVDALRG